LDQSQCSLFMTVRHIFEISEDDHPRLVTHARDIWWTLGFANAFVSPGVNSRGGLVPSHGASRRRLGDNLRQVDQFQSFNQLTCLEYITCCSNSICWQSARQVRSFGSKHSKRKDFYSNFLFIKFQRPNKIDGARLFLKVCLLCIYLFVCG
jgi:hypothetical protein